MNDSEKPGYSVALASNRVRRELAALSESDNRRITAALRELGENPRPRGSTRIRGDIYRIRVGRFRVLYSIDDLERTIIIGSVRRRSEDTYRDVRRLF